MGVHAMTDSKPRNCPNFDVIVKKIMFDDTFILLRVAIDIIVTIYFILCYVCICIRIATPA